MEAPYRSQVGRREGYIVTVKYGNINFIIKITYSVLPCEYIISTIPNITQDGRICMETTPRGWQIS